LDQPTSHSNSDARTQNQTPPAADSADRIGRLFLWLDKQEVSFIRLVLVNHRRNPKLAAINAFINSLGNGWIYLVAGLLLIGFKGRKAGWVILAASLSIAIAHLLFYPRIKSRLARLRPFDLDPALKPPVKCLDEYSCPSGHMMTAVAFGVPLGYAFPVTLPVICFFLLIIAWSRLALAHHYPTDLILGGAIGALIAIPITMLILKG
jgi:undecaprenyl-diphosphatase